MKPKLQTVWVAGMVAFLLTFVACKEGRPKGVIGPSEMENVLYDYHMAQALTDNLPQEEAYKKPLYTEAVFRRHGITQAQFDTSLVWYTRQAEELTKIYVQVNRRLKDRQSALNHQIALRDKKPLTTQKGDTVDIWYKDRLYRLTGSPASNKLEFLIPSDENFKFGDEFSWKVRFLFLDAVPGNKRAVMAMTVRFENDSAVSRVLPVKRSGVSVLRLKTDTLSKIREVSGFVYYAGDRNEVKTLLLDGIELIRFHRSERAGQAVPEVDPLQEQQRIRTDNRQNAATKEMQKTDLPELATQKVTEETVQPKRVNPRDLDRTKEKKP